MHQKSTDQSSETAGITVGQFSNDVDNLLRNSCWLACVKKKCLFRSKRDFQTKSLFRDAVSFFLSFARNG